MSEPLAEPWPRKSRALSFLCLLAVALPIEAQACPACGARGDGNLARLVLVGAMIVLPFVVALGCLLALRSLTREERPTAGRTGANPEAEGVPR